MPMPAPSLMSKVQRLIARSVLTLPRPVVARLAGAPIEKDGNVLDRQVQLALTLGRLARRKSAPELGPVKYRRELDEIGVALAPAPASLAAVRDLEVPCAGQHLARARLYVPHGNEAPSPGLVYFHGGGFVAGSIESHDAVCRDLATGARCRVLSVEYRLAPEHKFPAASDDAETAVAFALDHAEELGLDPSRLAIGGDSAGGNLAAVTALAMRGRAHAPVAQLLIYPACDLTMSSPSIESLGQGFMLETDTIRWFREQYLPAGHDRRDPRVSPLFAPSFAGAPPAIVVTAGFDPLRDEGLAYAQKLRDAGVSVTEHREGALFHGFLHTTGAITAARAALEAIALALGRALGTIGT
ncbi:MAG: alpha/beta hydrolase [Myxococcales bacterium]|nr:alpha/beta hydrolase [Myxococcales bacterium]